MKIAGKCSCDLPLRLLPSGQVGAKQNAELPKKVGALHSNHLSAVAIIFHDHSSLSYTVTIRSRTRTSPSTIKWGFYLLASPTLTSSFANLDINLVSKHYVDLNVVHVAFTTIVNSEMQFKWIALLTIVVNATCTTSKSTKCFEKRLMRHLHRVSVRRSIDRV